MAVFDDDDIFLEILLLLLALLLLLLLLFFLDGDGTRTAGVLTGGTTVLAEFERFCMSVCNLAAFVFSVCISC